MIPYILSNPWLIYQGYRRCDTTRCDRHRGVQRKGHGRTAVAPRGGLRAAEQLQVTRENHGQTKVSNEPEESVKLAN